MQKCDTLLSELALLLPSELSTATKRSKMMVTCYPGNGARYTRHCDNANKNGAALLRTFSREGVDEGLRFSLPGRRMTAILYLNPTWREGDGGQLRVFGPGTSEEIVATIPPLSNRLLIFWSDARAPHEVSVGSGI